MSDSNAETDTCSSCGHAIHPQLNPDKIRRRGGDLAQMPQGGGSFCQIFDRWTHPEQRCPDHVHVRDGYDANFD